MRSRLWQSETCVHLSLFSPFCSTHFITRWINDRQRLNPSSSIITTFTLCLGFYLQCWLRQISIVCKVPVSRNIPAVVAVNFYAPSLSLGRKYPYKYYKAVTEMPSLSFPTLTFIATRYLSPTFTPSIFFFDFSLFVSPRASSPAFSEPLKYLQASLFPPSPPPPQSQARNSDETPAVVTSSVNRRQKEKRRGGCGGTTADDRKVTSGYIFILVVQTWKSLAEIPQEHRTTMSLYCFVSPPSPFFSFLITRSCGCGGEGGEGNESKNSILLPKPPRSCCYRK